MCGDVVVKRPYIERLLIQQLNSIWKTQPNSQPPTENDGGRVDIIKRTHIVEKFFVIFSMKRLCLILFALFIGCTPPKDEISPEAQFLIDVYLKPNHIEIPELQPPPDKPTFIAVLDLTGNNISLGEARALSDRLRTEMLNTKHFKIVEREMMIDILNEQGLQQSGCISSECIVQVGQLIGVDKMIGGSISKVGDTYSVSTRIVSVETGNIIHTTSFDFGGKIDKLLTLGMKKVAIDLIK